MKTNRITFYLRTTAFSLAFMAFGLTFGCSDDDATTIKRPIKPAVTLKVDTLRLISYNVLEGMKLDTEEGKPTFVAWVKSFDPDILAIEEANGLNDAALKKLAASYDHKYVITLPEGSTYAPALTSKYPIELIRKITVGVYHGGIHVKIRGVNILVLHLYPFSKAEGGYPDGDQYRLAEITTYIENTIQADRFEERWLMMGDFNSVSPLDKKDLVDGDDRDYGVHTKILSSGYFDMLRTAHNYFISSCPTEYNAGGSPSRIDFIYGNSAMKRELTSATTIKDAFTNSHSDHYPLMMEYRVYSEVATKAVVK